MRLQRLALAMAGMGLLTKTDLLLPIIGGLYVLETCSVIAQVISFRGFGRRVLRMSPGRDSFDNHRFEGPPGGGYARPYADRHPPYMGEPYDRGYGRQRNFDPGPGYARPYRNWGGDRGGRGGGRWRH